MERDVMEQLVEWKNSADRKPLLLTGVRQCGKTYVCKEFGKQHFEDVAYFYFEGNKGLASVFEYDFDVNRIMDELGNVVRGKSIVPGKTLVIFDEIQACPNAITSLKYFCENMRELHIVRGGEGRCLYLPHQAAGSGTAAVVSFPDTGSPKDGRGDPLPLQRAAQPPYLPEDRR